MAFLAAILSCSFEGRVSPGARGSLSASSCLPPRGAVPPFFSRRPQPSPPPPRVPPSSPRVVACRVFLFASASRRRLALLPVSIAGRRLLLLLVARPCAFSPLRFARARCPNASRCPSLSPRSENVCANVRSAAAAPPPLARCILRRRHACRRLRGSRASARGVDDDIVVVTAGGRRCMRSCASWTEVLLQGLLRRGRAAGARRALDGDAL